MPQTFTSFLLVFLLSALNEVDIIKNSLNSQYVQCDE